MKQTFFAPLFVVLIALALAISIPRNSIRSDLNGHTTGGRERAWLFKPSDRIRNIRIITEEPLTVSLIANGGQGDFFMVLRLEYASGKLVNVGQLFIQKL